MTRAGWYEDPFELAPLRWWNGIEWTADTTGPPPFPWSIESSATERPEQEVVDGVSDPADDPPTSSTSRTSPDRMRLTPGLDICFTGSAVNAVAESVGRSGLEDLASRHGLVPCRSVGAMSGGLLIAADPERSSGKVDKARSLGIPIASLDAFLGAIETGRDLAVVCTRGAEPPGGALGEPGVQPGTI